MDDSRTNDQLTYDLMMDTLRAGALADPAAVFGTRQAGVRVVVTLDALGGQGTAGQSGGGQSAGGQGAAGQSAAGQSAGGQCAADHAAGIAHLEDGGDTLPAWVAGRAICDSGTVTCTFDAFGTPLDVGREQRLFTPKQRIALAIRDGGCRWEGCDMPASYCEAHHIDHYGEDRGRTDIDRGILLCRFHHMSMHNQGGKIRREGRGEFMLHPPGDRKPVPLRSQSPLRRNWLSPPAASCRRNAPPTSNLRIDPCPTL